MIRARPVKLVQPVQLVLLEKLERLDRRAYEDQLELPGLKDCVEPLELKEQQASMALQVPREQQEQREQLVTEARQEAANLQMQLPPVMGQ